MSVNGIVASLLDHFTRTWDMLREAIEAFPDEEWRVADEDDLIPARQALHVVESSAFYSGEWTGKKFPSGKRLGCDWELSPPEELPSQRDVLEYLEEAKAKVKAWLTRRGDEGLLGEPQDERFPWTGACELGRALYLMRHTHHHLGKIHAELRRRGIARPDWR
jgi:uncharacterized damage-inducible protein DinB